MNKDKNISRVFLLLVMLSLPLTLQAKLSVFACEPEWSALAG